MMTQDDILKLFRQQASDVKSGPLTQNDIILQLAQLLADSRGRLSKENFDALLNIGAALYKSGQEQFDARQNVSDIMRRSTEDHGNH